MADMCNGLMSTFKEFPPAQLPGSFTVGGVQKALFQLEAAGSGSHQAEVTNHSGFI